MKVKEKLKTFVPPSAHAFHNHVIASGSADQQILAQLENISAQLPEILAQLAAVSKQLAENFAQIQQESKHIVWEGHDFEYNALVFGGFFEAVQNTDFEEKYLKLVNGLDEESIETTNRIISRMQCCLARNDGIVPLDLFTQAEKDFFLFLQNEYFPSILKISDNCYVYKQYKLPINQFEPCVFLDKHGLMEMDTPIEQLEDKDIIDAGGFIGDSVLILSPLTKRNVYTFEPISDNYNLMQQTIAMNNVRNAVCEQMALGGGGGNKTLTFNIAGSCSNQFAHDACAHENVPVTTLDDYVKKHDLNVGLIKVDLEGAEQDFLKGAKETIMTQKPVLLLSIYHNADDFFHLKTILESWNCGYQFKIHKGLDYCFYLETLLIAEVR